MSKIVQDCENDILSTVRAALQENAAGCRLLLAVSGGADSVVMLDVVARLAPELGYSVVVGHIDHGLRLESSEDAEFVSTMANNLGLSFVLERVNVYDLMQMEHLSQEAAARKVRYRTLEEMARIWHCDRILTAHTADDSGETFLMRFLQSPDWWEWTSIPARRGNILRPLLTLRRQQIRDYALQAGLSWRDDPSNEEIRHLRNFLRLRVLPQFSENGQSVNLPALAEAGDRIRDIVDDILNEADKFVQEQRDKHQEMVLAIPDILSYFNMICWAPAERAVAAMLWDSNFRWPAWRRRQVSDFIVARASRGLLHLEKGAILLRQGQWLALITQPPESISRFLRECGSHSLDGLGEIELSIGANNGIMSRGDRIHASAALLDKGLQIRTWQPGDRLNIFRRGHRKISDLLNELRLDPISRQNALVLCDEEGPFWLVGHWSDHRARPSPDDKLVLELKWRKL